MEWKKNEYTKGTHAYSTQLADYTAACFPSLTEKGKWVLDSDVEGASLVKLEVENQTDEAVIAAARKTHSVLPREKQILV